MTTIKTTDFVYHVHSHVIPAALDLLPAKMSSPEARAMLLAIGFQESRFCHRVQVPKGPARGFWQFEKMGAVKGVMEHPTTDDIIASIVTMFNYQFDVDTCYRAIEHNDVLACVFARLLLWTMQGRLPSSTQGDIGWTQYLGAWRPGKPHRESWDACFAEAWRIVLLE